MSAKKLIIIGAGDVGGYLAYNLKMFGSFELMGFLDDNPSKIGKEYYGFPVLGPITFLQNYENEVSVAICIATPVSKKMIFERIKNWGHQFPSFVSPRAWVSEGVSIGQGVFLYPGVSINYETVVEDFVIMNMNCAIGHNCHISKFTALAPGVKLAGFTNIGEAVDVGIGVATKQSVNIGANSIIGGQSMIINNVPDGSKVVGVPGKIMIDKA